MATELVRTRLGIRTDEPLIYSTWLAGLRRSFFWFECLAQDYFYEVYHKEVENILTRPKTQVLICCLKDDDDVILGYSIIEENILHWVYVKPAWRKMGIAKTLVPETIRYATHFTKIGLKIRPDHITFNPFV